MQAYIFISLKFFLLRINHTGTMIYLSLVWESMHFTLSHIVKTSVSCFSWHVHFFVLTVLNRQDITDCSPISSASKFLFPHASTRSWA